MSSALNLNGGHFPICKRGLLRGWGEVMCVPTHLSGSSVIIFPTAAPAQPSSAIIAREVQAGQAVCPVGIGLASGGPWDTSMAGHSSPFLPLWSLSIQTGCPTASGAPWWGWGSDAPYLLRGPWDSAQTPLAYLTGKPNGKALEARHASILTATVLTSGWFSERQNGESWQWSLPTIY